MASDTPQAQSAVRRRIESGTPRQLPHGLPRFLVCRKLVLDPQRGDGDVERRAEGGEGREERQPARGRPQTGGEHRRPGRAESLAGGSDTKRRFLRCTAWRRPHARGRAAAGPGRAWPAGPPPRSSPAAGRHAIGHDGSSRCSSLASAGVWAASACDWWYRCAATSSKFSMAGRSPCSCRMASSRLMLPASAHSPRPVMLATSRSAPRLACSRFQQGSSTQAGNGSCTSSRCCSAWRTGAICRSCSGRWP